MVSKESTAKRARARKESQVDARADSVRPAAPVLDAALVSDRLRNLLSTLQHSISVVILSVEALRCQDADADRDIVAILKRSVGDRLDIEIERLSELIAMLDRRPLRVEEEAASYRVEETEVIH